MVTVLPTFIDFSGSAADICKAGMIKVVREINTNPAFRARYGETNFLAFSNKLPSITAYNIVR